MAIKLKSKFPTLENFIRLFAPRPRAGVWAEYKDGDDPFAPSAYLTKNGEKGFTAFKEFIRSAARLAKGDEKGCEDLTVKELLDRFDRIACGDETFDE